MKKKMKKKTTNKQRREKKDKRKQKLKTKNKTNLGRQTFQVGFVNRGFVFFHCGNHEYLLKNMLFFAKIL